MSGRRIVLGEQRRGRLRRWRRRRRKRRTGDGGAGGESGDRYELPRELFGVAALVAQGGQRDFTGYYAGTAALNLQLDAKEWATAYAQSAGKSDPLTVELSAITGAP
jgi:hypothetical protein